MGSALHRELTLKNMITPAVLDAPMNLDSLTHYNVLSQAVQHLSFSSGDMLRYYHEEIIFYTT